MSDGILDVLGPNGVVYQRGYGWVEDVLTVSSATLFDPSYGDEIIVYDPEQNSRERMKLIRIIDDTHLAVMRWGRTDARP